MSLSSFQLTTTRVGISLVSLYATAHTLVVDGRGVGVGTAGVRYAGVAAGLVVLAALLEGGAVRVHPALGLLLADAVVVEELVGRTDALGAGGVEDVALGAVAHAPAVLDDEAEIEAAGNALARGVDDVSRRADALQVFVQDQALTRGTSLDRGTLHRGVTLVAGEALASHGPDGQGVQNAALGVQTAGVGQGTWVLALSLNTSRLARALSVTGASNNSCKIINYYLFNNNLYRK